MTLPLRTLLAITETTETTFFAREPRGHSSRPTPGQEPAGQEPMPPQNWWNPGRHADRSASLRAHGRLKKALRCYFEEAGFVEVECGILQTSPGNEAHLHAFATDFAAPDGARKRLYLHTSPEFACKKLLAAGERRIFEFARVFRNRERSDLHAPEFTMLEWYRGNETYESAIGDCTELLRVAARAVPAHMLSFRGRMCNPFREAE